MRVEIYKDQYQDKTVRLALEKGMDGSSVVLCAVDECGQRLPKGAILKINKTGYVELIGGLNPDLGFRHKAGRIAVSS